MRNLLSGPLFCLGFLLVSTPATAGSVTLNTADGKSIVAQTSGQGEKGVVLVHDAGRSAADWGNFAERLASNGFAVIAVDVRGHGASTRAEPELGDDHWPAMVADVDAAATWLSGKGSKQVAVVGSVFGASLAANAAVDSEHITNLVLLSPSLNTRGVRVAGAMASWTGPSLIVADSKDPAGARAATLLGEKTSGARVELVDAGASGHRMLNTVPELEALLVGWLNGSKGEGAELARPDRTLDAGSVGSIETTGEAYGGER